MSTIRPTVSPLSSAASSNSRPSVEKLYLAKSAAAISGGEGVGVTVGVKVAVGLGVIVAVAVFVGVGVEVGAGGRGPQAERVSRRDRRGEVFYRLVDLTWFACAPYNPINAPKRPVFPFSARWEYQSPR